MLLLLQSSKWLFTKSPLTNFSRSNISLGVPYCDVHADFACPILRSLKPGTSTPLSQSRGCSLGPGTFELDDTLYYVRDG